MARTAGHGNAYTPERGNSLSGGATRKPRTITEAINTMKSQAETAFSKREKKVKKDIDVRAGVCNNAAMIKNGTANTEGERMKLTTVRTTGGKLVRTWDNPLNAWVRSLDDGQLYRTEGV
jgi:hypothetical protein